VYLCKTGANLYDKNRAAAGGKQGNSAHSFRAQVE